MGVCTFFGHKDCYNLDVDRLRTTIEALIRQGVDTFYLGHQGQFDSTVLACLEKLQKEYPLIHFSVVLAYLPMHKTDHDLYSHCSILPEGLELVPPKFAIAQRNRWMLEHADHCICYVNHSWGGAYKYICIAKQHGLCILNIGTLDLS